MKWMQYGIISVFWDEKVCCSERVVLCNDELEVNQPFCVNVDDWNLIPLHAAVETGFEYLS